MQPARREGLPRAGRRRRRRRACLLRPGEQEAEEGRSTEERRALRRREHEDTKSEADGGTEREDHPERLRAEPRLQLRTHLDEHPQVACERENALVDEEVAQKPPRLGDQEGVDKRELRHVRHTGRNRRRRRTVHQRQEAGDWRSILQRLALVLIGENCERDLKEHTKGGNVDDVELLRGRHGPQHRKGRRARKMTLAVLLTDRDGPASRSRSPSSRVCSRGIRFRPPNDSVRCLRIQVIERYVRAACITHKGFAACRPPCAVCSGKLSALRSKRPRPWPSAACSAPSWWSSSSAQPLTSIRHAVLSF